MQEKVFFGQNDNVPFLWSNIAIYSLPKYNVVLGVLIVSLIARYRL